MASSFLAYAARIRGPEDLPILLQRERALAYMRQRLGDPDLDVDRIAVGCHISRRTLHRLFEGTGHTVMSHLRTLGRSGPTDVSNQADLSIESVARKPAPTGSEAWVSARLWKNADTADRAPSTSMEELHRRLQPLHLLDSAGDQFGSAAHQIERPGRSILLRFPDSARPNVHRRSAGGRRRSCLGSGGW